MGAVGCLTLIALAAPDAQACSVAGPPPALAGYPEANASGVPTDVRPIFERDRIPGYLAALSQPTLDDDGNPRPAPLELVDDAGTIIPLSLGTGGGTWHLEFVPAQALQPHTHYLIRVAQPGAMDIELSFTTGDGPVTSPPEPPQVSIEHYELDSDWSSSCGSLKTGTCSSFPPPEPGVYVQMVGFYRSQPGSGQAPYLSPRPWFYDITGIDRGQYDCMEFRSRAANGAMSEPIIRCREDGPLYDLGDTQHVACTTAGITKSGILVSELADDDAGCSVAPGRSPTAGFGASRLGAALPLLGLLALPLLRRRARAAQR